MTPDSRRGTLIYLTLSAASGLIELGGVLFALRMGASVGTALCFGLAYQVGALFKNPIELRGWHYRVLVGLATAAAIAACWDWHFFLPALMLLSAGLQGLREEALIHSGATTLAKRLSRIVGFVSAGVFDQGVMAVVGLVILAVAKYLPRQTLSAAELNGHAVPRRSLGLVGVVMVLHQMHYFVYAYAIPTALVRAHGLSNLWVGPAFALGWVSYSFAPAVLGRLPTLPVVVLGHLTVTLTLLFAAARMDNTAALLTAWFASGFGGGTVFCIRRLADRWASVDGTTDIDTWENVGHVLGVLLAVGIALLTPDLRELFRGGAWLALLVAGSLMVVSFVRWERR